jgi:hypothetical protein
MKYLKDFFEEEELACEAWTVEHNGETHIFDVDFMVSLIIDSPLEERRKISDVLRRLDFYNAPIIPFLKHLSEGFVKANCSEVPS